MKRFYRWKTVLEKNILNLDVVARLQKSQIIISGIYKTEQLQNFIIDIDRFTENEREELVVIGHKIMKEDIPRINKMIQDKIDKIDKK